MRNFSARAVLAKCNIATERLGGQSSEVTTQPSGNIQFPLAEPLVGILARERVRPLVGDRADLADLVTTAPQVGAEGVVPEG